MGKSKELAELASSDGSIQVTNTLNLTSASGSRIYSDVANAYSYVVSMNPAGSGLATHYHNANEFRIQTGNVDRLAVDTAGRVTMPYQPAFRAHQTTDPTSDRTLTSASGVNWAVQYDRGNNFSGGTFTAPVGGVYSFSIMWDALAALSRVNLLVNGAAYAQWEPTGLDTASWESHHYASDVYLNVGDYAQLELVNSSGSNPVHMGYGTWGHFSGHLIG